MSSKQWTVGYFEKENKYSVISDSWLISCGNMWISRWPKTGNISKMISEHAEYGNDWPTYPVKLVSQYYNNYKEATTKKRQIFISASASESEHTVRVIPKSPVLQKKRTYYKTFQQDDSDSISSATLTPIKVKKSVQDKPTTEIVLDDETVVSRPFINTSRSNYFQTDNEMVQSITSISSALLTPKKVKKSVQDKPATETVLDDETVVSRPFINTSRSNYFQTDNEMFQSITSVHILYTEFGLLISSLHGFEPD
ncbi:DUF4806 domain-containing protein [Aphis craccivora]|uniref:DUF4806 domain-containing protein n=1 Tax=Aphis craccivora TaxID=307492 RepID=A0A6G0YHG3_APHCR|nr:DUF4806 domain-containing protein [Aphis craccivora]